MRIKPKYLNAQNIVLVLAFVWDIKTSVWLKVIGKYNPLLKRFAAINELKFNVQTLMYILVLCNNTIHIVLNLKVVLANSHILITRIMGNS